ncbi:hypothetical protein [Desulfobacter postgatei]|uniref:hypothetical protein n=1 Tax=Desulfobacter postgatei TaxID=2293 RepID=UPI00259B61A7|nr:hypothetical protein [uncultured Desulfobacter sp.]
MLIRHGYFVKNLYLKNRKYPITFTYGGAHSIKVLLKKSSKKIPPVKGNNDISICRAWGTFKPSDKVKQYFISISNNELPNEMVGNANALDYLKNTAKSVERIHIDYFPQPFKDFIHNVRSELYDVIKRTVGIFMWRCGIPDGHDPLFNGGMSFSLDGKKWNMVPPGIKVEVHAASILQTPQRISLSLKKLINNAEDQPVGHQLYREAQYLRNTNPRISIVVAISALEVAVKECISKLNPNSNWLVENLPSPDVRKLINEYIPKLLCGTTLERVLPLPKDLNDTIRKGVQIRNQVAHLGRKAPSRESINEILSAVQEVLWLLDVCSGHNWAIEYIGNATRDHIKQKMKSKG